MRGEERQKSGFEFEEIVENMFKNIQRDKQKKNYTGEYDAILVCDGEVIPCQMKHTTKHTKKHIELGDLGRNFRKDKEYFLICGYDTNDKISDVINIHFKNYTKTISNDSGLRLRDVYVYHIKPTDLKIDLSVIEEYYNSNIDNSYTKCMDIDNEKCDFNDESVFKYGRGTTHRTISKPYVKKDVLLSYKFFNTIDRKHYNNSRGFVVYEPKDGFVTHIPVNDNGEPYQNVSEIPCEYSAILKIDNTTLTDFNWGIIRRYINKEFKKTNIVKLNPKRDHKKQFRFQCSIKSKCIEQCMCDYDDVKFEM